MGMRQTITSLAIFGAGVPGIARSFDLNEMPQKLNRQQLPCLICIPQGNPDAGYKPLAFMGGSPTLSFEITQRCFIAETANLNMATALPKVVMLLDAYVDAAKLTRFISVEQDGSSTVPLVFSVELGFGEWDEVGYHVIDFKHKIEVPS